VNVFDIIFIHRGRNPAFANDVTCHLCGVVLLFPHVPPSSV
jgi:hypothetical protein